MIRASREKRIQVTYIKCGICSNEFNDDEEGIRLASEHEKTHGTLRYLHPESRYSDTVWVDEEAVLRTDSPWEIKVSINHKNKGRTFIDWEGPGWYVFHEYEAYFRGERETRTEFIHVDAAKRALKEKFDDMKQDWRNYIELQRTPRP